MLILFAVRSSFYAHHRPVLLFVLLRSMEGRDLDPRSTLLLTLLLDDLRRRKRISLGSAVSKPPTRAKRIKTSVKLTTPTRRPPILMPGSAPADTEGPAGLMTGVLGEASATW